MLKKPPNGEKSLLTALVANRSGEIFELDGYAAVGMAGEQVQPLSVDDTRNLPYGGELMFLPDRRPILLNRHTGKLETSKENPFAPGQPLFPVAVFNSPGYVVSAISGYRENKNAGPLPLFSYGAVGWHRGKFRSAVIRVDAERRQDLRLMKHEDVVAGIERMRRQMPQNRLRAHLERCALEYGCPAAKNFFLGRCEAPLPSSGQCNARCLGCLSLQQHSGISRSQQRIAFTPSAGEITEVALAHIKRVKHSVVSFGQGCEGDPLMAFRVIEPAIGRIRLQTGCGTINMNTNGSLPDRLGPLLDVGLDSIRISINSVRKKCYEAYFRPRDYGFSDVLKSIDLALARGKFVALNYLNMAGFTDTPAEVAALGRFLEKFPIHMIQWRNLNFDPLRYWQAMNRVGAGGRPVGMQTVLEQIRKQFPRLKYGYFNPPKERFEN
jgi:molybdenum cofactor biosynthesis enzyme MoaA